MPLGGWTKRLHEHLPDQLPVSNQSWAFLPSPYSRLRLVISHLISLNSESINLGSFVEQKSLFLLADKVLLFCQKAVLTGQSSRAARSAEAESWNF